MEELGSFDVIGRSHGATRLFVRVVVSRELPGFSAFIPFLASFALRLCTVLVLLVTDVVLKLLELLEIIQSPPPPKR